MKNINSIRRYKIITIDREDVTIFDGIPIQDIIGKTIIRAFLSFL